MHNRRSYCLHTGCHLVEIYNERFSEEYWVHQSSEGMTQQILLCRVAQNTKALLMYVDRVEVCLWSLLKSSVSSCFNDSHLFACC